MFIIYRYITRKVGFDARKDRYGLFVAFNEDIEVFTENLIIQPITLLTRIGGIIGVGKELLWVALSLATFAMALTTKIK